MNKFAVIVAGGSGTRMNMVLPKQFLLLQGKPVLWYTITAFLAAFTDIQVILVLPEQYRDMGQSIIATTVDPARVQITTGGDTRFQSVKNGLQWVADKSIVFVHDGVRCLVTPALIQACYKVALEKGNAVPAVSTTDSLRVETDKGNKIIDRSQVKIIQTPQVFQSAILLKAFEQSYDPAFTDEAAVVESIGTAIHLVQGDAANIKITHPVDLLVAEKILEARG